MTRTDNCQLPQWEETDRILMEDFNDMCGKIDAGITQAQEAAQAAQTAAEAAQEEAEKLPYVYGTYTGTLGEQTIDIGFEPRMVYINGEDNSQDTTHIGWCSGLFGPHQMLLSANILPNGFKVFQIGDYLPKLNVSGRQYRYIAFR